MADVNQHKIMLDESEMPTALVQRPARPAVSRRRRCTPARAEPAAPEDLAPLFPMDLILQEVSSDPASSTSPGRCTDVYRHWSPSPLFRAHRLEKALGTPARIYYKYEGVSRPARTSPTPPCRRRTTTPRPASRS